MRARAARAGPAGRAPRRRGGPPYACESSISQRWHLHLRWPDVSVRDDISMRIPGRRAEQQPSNEGLILKSSSSIAKHAA